MISYTCYPNLIVNTPRAIHFKCCWLMCTTKTSSTERQWGYSAAKQLRSMAMGPRQNCDGVADSQSRSLSRRCTPTMSVIYARIWCCWHSWRCLVDCHDDSSSAGVLRCLYKLCLPTMLATVFRPNSEVILESCDWSLAAGMTHWPIITADAVRGFATSFRRLLIAKVLDQAIQQRRGVQLGQSVSHFNLKQAWDNKDWQHLGISILIVLQDLVAVLQIMKPFHVDQSLIYPLKYATGQASGFKQVEGTEHRHYTGKGGVFSRSYSKHRVWLLMTMANAGSMVSMRERECLLNDNHQKGKMMIMIMKTSGSQVDSPVAEGKRKYNKCRSQRCHLLWSKGTWRGVTFTNDVSRNQRSVR